MTAGKPSKRGAVLVISGPSGVGKSTICHRLCEALPAEFSVSVTTRPPRPGEANARDYHYISREAFDEMLDREALLEWAEVYGHRYGTPIAPVQRALDEQRIVVLEIDIKGCVQVREKMPEAKTVFLLPPSPDEQQRRIEGRNTDSKKVIRERLSKADGEIRFAMDSGCYDEFVVNDNVDETVAGLRRLVEECE